MAFPDEFLTELKYRTDIESLVSEYVHLKRAGSRLVGLCPFHSEKTPSFTVFTDDPHYHCFGCGAGGDVITFVRGVEGLDYADAVRLLAKRAGMDMPEDRAADPELIRRRERLLAANREAALFFHERLLAGEGAAALSYLKGRGLGMGVIRRFGLGWAPDSWDSLTNHLRAAGYTEAELRDGRLAGVSKKGTSYDYFRGRVMFPIIDVRKNVIAFGGRVLDGAMPKYLNSPDTPVFKKSMGLYALNMAKTHLKERAILAEGYMDVIALHAAGFENAVATLGTALTKEQARLLRRYTEEVVIAYDSDGAGKTATRRAIGILSEAGLTVRVLAMDGAKDPDEFIAKYGKERFAALITGSSGHVEYELDTAATQYNLENPDERVSYLRDAVAVLAGLSSPIQADVYAGRLAISLGVDKANILKEVERLRKKRAASYKKDAIKNQAAALQSKARSPQVRGGKIQRAEEGVLAAIFHNPEYLELVTAEDFTSDLNKRLYTALHGIISRGGAPDTSLLGQDFSVEEMGIISGMLQSAGTGDARELEDFLETIKSGRERSILSKAVESGDAGLEDIIELRRREIMKQP